MSKNVPPGRGGENPAAGGAGRLLPGLKPVLELLRSEPRRVDAVFVRKGRKDNNTSELLDLCRAAGVRFSLLEGEAMRRLCAGSGQAVAARLFTPGFSSLEESAAAALASPLPLLLALDQVQDAGNAGALARTLYALGGGGIILPGRQAAYLGAGAARSAAGALEKLPIAKEVNLGRALDKLKDLGFTVYGSVARGAPPQEILDIYDLRPVFPAVLALGGEKDGLRPGIAKRCAALLRIPMFRDFDSLNVAQAGAILLGFFSAARRDAGFAHPGPDAPAG